MERNYKADFPLLAGSTIAYLDSAATAQRPQCVLDAQRDFDCHHNANPLRGLYPLSVEATEIYEDARERVRAFLHARSAREIIFTRNTSESLNLVAYSYGLSHLRAGDECAPDGSLDLNRVEECITGRTRLVAITQVSNVLGRRYPVKEIAALAHRRGAVVVVDGAQSTPHLPVDVQDLDADFFALSGHKLYGPMGIGVLYGKEALLEEMPPFLSGGEMIESVSRTGAVYAELPHKFEAGTVNASGAAGLRAAIDYIESIGLDKIHQRELQLSADAFERMRAIPHLHLLGSDQAEEHNGILTFVIDGVHPHDVGEILAADGVCVRAGHHCAQPLLQHLGHTSTVRASYSFYNTPADTDRLIESLSAVRERMGYGK